MKTDTCDYPGCSNQISNKCTSCGQTFCPRHCQLETRGTEYASQGLYICNVCQNLKQRRLKTPVRSVSVIVVQETLSVVLECCTKALQACGMKVTNINSVAGEINAGMKGPFWTGSGETITITVMKSAGQDLFVLIESKANQPYQIVDLHGRIERNIKLILAELPKHIKFRHWLA
jgi:hypothetical protein